MRYQWGMAVGHVYMYQNFPAPTIPTIPPDFDFSLLPHGSSNHNRPSSSVIPETSQSSGLPSFDPSQSGVQHQNVRPASDSIESQSSLGRATTQLPVTGTPPMDLLGHFTSTSHCGNSNNPHSLCPPTIAVPASSPTLTHPVASQQLQPTAAPSRGQLAHASDDAEVDDLVGDDLDDLPDGR